MGCTPSRVMRERLEHATIDDLLQDDEFVTYIIPWKQSLSSKSLHKLYTLVQKEHLLDAKPSSGFAGRNDLKPLLGLEEGDTTLHHELVPFYDSWARNPKIFVSLESDVRGLGYLTRIGRDVAPPKTKSVVKRVKRRFQWLFFYQASRIKRGYSYPEEWVRYGQQYDRLASRLGIGCLFLLPVKIADHLWCKRLPQEGNYFEEAIALLKRLSIVANAARIDANRVGTSIRETLLQPLISGRAVNDQDAAPKLHFASESVYNRIPVVVPYDSPILLYVQAGDIAGLRELWQTGQATIDTVDPYGLGLLYYSTYYCWRSCGVAKAMATCKVLLDAGVDVAWRDDLGNAPIDTMLDCVLAQPTMSGKPDHTALRDVARLFGVPLDEAWGPYVESRGFTELHEVLLGIYGAEETLDEYLNRSATEGRLAGIIDAPDFSGRSALAWAVAYGWARAAASLVAHGANVDQRTPSGTGELPVLHIALAGPASGEPTCDFLAIVSLLLSAGADPNAVDHEGWTALHIAASWNSSDAVRILLRCSRSPVNISALNYEGKTAAQVAAESGADLMLIDVLASGVNCYF